MTIQLARKKPGFHQGAKLVETAMFMERCNIKLDDVDKLNVIHVSGTKGKGSTCAFTESILRRLGYKTGFYSSPHLVQVRERIRINGRPLSESAFAKYFFTVYERLQKEAAVDGAMPAYFKFLTLMAFHVFIEEKVDVAIIEVGIGGEHDCTNIVRQKAGIFKPGSVAIVADQTEQTMRVMTSRAIERKTDVPPFTGMVFQKDENEMPARGSVLPGFRVPDEFLDGIRLCEWPGRSQVLKLDSVTYFLDGAHTPKSLQDCNFDVALFCPTRVRPVLDMRSDQANLNQSEQEQRQRVEHNMVVWKQLTGEETHAEHFDCITAAIEKIEAMKSRKGHEVEVLVTGSLHLVGGVLALIQPHS
uniref:tetrahydrofolate synthase n=1 Tax=Ascaris lumbricoides TaxID=6252 RepID=A0A0M3IH22_ASCLU